MSSKQQMKRGKNQSLYKYLPETWIDFSVRGKERKQYIAKVLRWNSEKLDGINAKRLIRTVNESVHSFENQASATGPIKPTVGFGAELTKDKTFTKIDSLSTNQLPENNKVQSDKISGIGPVKKEEGLPKI